LSSPNQFYIIILSQMPISCSNSWFCQFIYQIS